MEAGGLRDRSSLGFIQGGHTKMGEFSKLQHQGTGVNITGVIIGVNITWSPGPDLRTSLCLAPQ